MLELSNVCHYGYMEKPKFPEGYRNRSDGGVEVVELRDGEATIVFDNSGALRGDLRIVYASFGSDGERAVTIGHSNEPNILAMLLVRLLRNRYSGRSVELREEIMQQILDDSREIPESAESDDLCNARHDVQQAVDGGAEVRELDLAGPDGGPVSLSLRDREDGIVFFIKTQDGEDEELFCVSDQDLLALAARVAEVGLSGRVGGQIVPTIDGLEG